MWGHVRQRRASSPPHARAPASALPSFSSKTLAQAWTPKSIVLRSKGSSRVWPAFAPPMRLPQCDRLAIGSSWSRNDLFLSVDRSADAAIWDPQGIRRRSISGSRRDAAIHLACQSRIECRSTRLRSFPAGRRAERGGDPFPFRRIRFGQKARPADGNHLSQHRAASWRADDDDALRDLPGMEFKVGTFTSLPLEPICCGLYSSLPATRSSVCCFPQTSTLDRQDDRNMRPRPPL
jgi:hypothetical protein